MGYEMAIPWLLGTRLGVALDGHGWVGGGRECTEGRFRVYCTCSEGGLAVGVGVDEGLVEGYVWLRLALIVSFTLLCC